MLLALQQHRFSRTNQGSWGVVLRQPRGHRPLQMGQQGIKGTTQSKASAHQTTIKQDVVTRSDSMKEVSIFELLIRNLGRFAAGSGVVALLVWLTWVMLDVQHMQSGFTLPQSSY